MDSDTSADGLPMSLQEEAENLHVQQSGIQCFPGDGGPDSTVDVLENMSLALDSLQAQRQGAAVAVVTMLGSFCPVTLAHVQCFVLAKQVLLGQAATSSLADVECFQVVLGFFSLNSDERVMKKLQGEASLGHAGRKRCINLAVNSLDWLGWEAYEGCSLSKLRARWPMLHFVQFSMNGADDVLRYQKWRHTNVHNRVIAVGRPGFTEKLLSALKDAGFDGGNKQQIILLPEVGDVSSTQARKALASHDTQVLASLLDRNVAAWCLEHWPIACIHSDVWTKWFIGVREKEVLLRGREHFFDPDSHELINCQTGKRWPVGAFNCPTIAELRGTINSSSVPSDGAQEERPFTPLVIMGGVDIGHMQAKLQTDDAAMVQVASNFNCLEVGSRSHFPCSGDLIEGYAMDVTQGPAASFGVPAACFLRTHYLFQDVATDPTTWGQTADKQLELLCNARRSFGTCVNGKVSLTGAEMPVDHDAIVDLSDTIRVGVHADAQVVFGRSAKQPRAMFLLPEPLPVVDQVLVAAVNWNSPGERPEPAQLERLTRAALRAAYHGAYLAAISRKRRLLLLTLVGGGVFRNPIHMILEELANAHDCWADHPASALDEVRLCIHDNNVSGIAKIRSELQTLMGAKSKLSVVQWGATNADLRNLDERCLLQKFLKEVADDTKMVCFGIQHTIQALEKHALQTVIVWENLHLARFRVNNLRTGVESACFVVPTEWINEHTFKDPHTGDLLEVLEKQLVVDWLVAACKTFEVELKLVQDKCTEGRQFCKAFCGIGGFLKCFMHFEEPQAEDYDSDDDF